MKFTRAALAGLIEPNPDGPQVAAERANLRMEERVSAVRQAAYEDRIGVPETWDDWRASHARYVEEEVRRRHPPSAAFNRGEPSLRPDIEPNQSLYRVERIDAMLRLYAAEMDEPVRVERIREWISARGSDTSVGGRATSLRDLGRSMHDGASSPKAAALEDLTEFFNDWRKDGRPAFVACSAEFPRLDERSDWAQHMCERCGLAHFLTGGEVTLALFRYRVQEVLDACVDGEARREAAVFAVPTVLDQPMSHVYFTAPADMSWGHAVGLAPEPDCRHLAAELIHARMDYRSDHWAAVDTLRGNAPSDDDVVRLREAHLECIRRSPGNSGYGRAY